MAVPDLFAAFKTPSLLAPWTGYGGTVPTGVPGSMQPGTQTGNTTGGYSTFMNTGAGAANGGVQPWTPPTWGGGAAGGGMMPGMGGGYQAPPATGGGATLPGGGGMPMPGGMSGGGAPAGGANSGWLNSIIGQAGNLTSQIPQAPDMGLNQSQSNLLNYQTYLQNLANSNNDRRFNLALQATQGAGTTARTDAQQIADKQNAQNQQNLVSSGLNNTTISPTLSAGVNRELARQLQSIDEGTAQQIIQILSSRTDQGPGANALSDMLRASQNQANPMYMPPGFGGGGITYGGNYGATLRGGL